MPNDSSSFRLPAGLVAALAASALAHAVPAGAHQPHRPTHVVVVDRTGPGWWRGRAEFAAYTGPRRGYLFAPGYGYYVPPRGYYGRRWAAGATLPRPMVRYVVIEPRIYGLRPPPPGYRWYYAGDRIVLAAIATGLIVRSVAGGW